MLLGNEYQSFYQHWSLKYYYIIMVSNFNEWYLSITILKAKAH